MPLDDMTLQEIKKRILARAKTELDAREGSFLDAMAGPVSAEIADIAQIIDAAIAIAFVDESSGAFLDLEGEKYGLPRKLGQKAVASVILSGEPGTIIYAGTTFLTAGELCFILTNDVALDNEGQGIGVVEAAEIGTKYNIPADTLIRTYADVPGLTGFTNAAAQHGVDEESDADYFRRIDTYRKHPVTSETIHYYANLALGVGGVSYAIVTPKEDGPGTFGIMVAGPQKQPVDAATIEQLAAELEAKHIICQGVRCYSVQPTPITVSATITTDGSVTPEEVQTALVSKLDTYFDSLPLDKTIREVSYHQVAYQLLAIPGVVDYHDLLLCGGEVGVSIGATSVPVLDTVEVTAQ